MKTLFTPQRLIGVSVVLLVQLIAVVTLAQTKHVVGVTSNIFSPKELTVNVGDTVEWQNTEGWHNVNGTKTTFPGNPESFGNSQGSGWTYSYVFSTEGTYDYQCDPHAFLGMTGKIMVNSATDDKHMLTVKFANMGPHNGQTLRLWVIDNLTEMTLYNTEVTVSPEFDIVTEGLEDGKSYRVDFYADHNLNGSYDAPPTDHAWRLELDNVMSDTVLSFNHNVSFTDIFAVTDVQETRDQPFLMYPNPASSRVTLEYAGFNYKPSVRVFDLSGKARDVRISENTGSRIELDISKLPIGIYLVQLQYDESVVTQKLLKK